MSIQSTVDKTRVLYSQQQWLVQWVGGHVNQTRVIRILPGTSQLENWSRVGKASFQTRKGTTKMSAWNYHFPNSLSNGEADPGEWSWKTEVELWEDESAGEPGPPSFSLLWPCPGLTVCINKISYLPKPVWVGPLWHTTKESWVKPYSIVNNLPGAIRPERNILPIKLLLPSAKSRLVWGETGSWKHLSSDTFLSMLFLFFYSCKTFWLCWARATLYTKEVQTNHMGFTKVMIKEGKKGVAGLVSLAHAVREGYTSAVITQERSCGPATGWERGAT